MSWAGLAIGAATVIGGEISKSSANSKAKKLRAQRKTFTTSSEVFDIVSATTSRASSGYGAETLDYLTNQIERAGAGVQGTAKRMGANPNDLSALFDQQMQGLMKVGAENNALNMENFSKFIGAKELLSKNIEAEWASSQGMIRDDLQAAAQAKQEATAQISSGINAGISSIASSKISDLYKPKGKNPGVGQVAPISSSAVRSSGASIAAPAGQRILGINSDGSIRYGV